MIFLVRSSLFESLIVGFSALGTPVCAGKLVAC